MNEENNLFDYGIQNENSDIRIHVCVKVQKLYVFPTKEGIAIIKTGKYPKKPATQKGYSGITAWGYPVPPKDIHSCIAIQPKPSLWHSYSFDPNDETSVKGQKAVNFVYDLLKKGLIPLPNFATQLSDKDLDIEGTDIIVHKRDSINLRSLKIQVKCDYPGGPKEYGGTGNLFLQIAERNPFHKV